MPAHRRKSGLVVVNGVNGSRLKRKPTRKEVQKAAAEGIAARILRFEQRLDVQEKMLDGLVGAVLEYGLPREVFQAKCKEAGLDIQIVCMDEGEGEGEAPRPVQCNGVVSGVLACLRCGKAANETPIGDTQAVCEHDYQVL